MCGYVEIFDDILVEEDEMIEVTATFEHSEPEISLIRNTASTTITDNDCKACTYRVENVFNHPIFAIAQLKWSRKGHRA